MVAGHDTTAHSAAWILIELSRHPEALKKLQQEIDRVNPDPNEPLDASELAKLSYLNQVREF